MGSLFAPLGLGGVQGPEEVQTEQTPVGPVLASLAGNVPQGGWQVMPLGVPASPTPVPSQGCPDCASTLVEHRCLLWGRGRDMTCNFIPSYPARVPFSGFSPSKPNVFWVPRPPSAVSVALPKKQM